MQPEGAASAKALKWEYAGHAKKAARRPMWLQQSDQEGGGDEVRDQNTGPDHAGPQGYGEDSCFSPE